MYITKNECNRVIDNVNGFDMTYGDYLTNTNVEYEVIDDIYLNTSECEQKTLAKLQDMSNE